MWWWYCDGGGSGTVVEMGSGGSGGTVMVATLSLLLCLSLEENVFWKGEPPKLSGSRDER